ncbi:MAG: DedA family protein [Acidimicrobiales bacterium]
MSIHHLIETYGYVAVFVLVGAESLGVPLPGETTLLAAAAYAGVHPHRLSIGVIFAVAAAAAILGDTTGYWIGDKGGYRLVYRYGRYVKLDESKIKVARYLFDRRGGAVIFFGRFVSILRTYAAFLAGTTRMRYRRFLFFNAAGGIFWAALYAFLAYYAGSFLSTASTPFEIGFASLAVVFIVSGLLVLRRHMSTIVARAEAAYPGPLESPEERDRSPGRGRRAGGRDDDRPAGVRAAEPGSKGHADAYEAPRDQPSA